MKKYSIEAKELLTTVELYEIKAGAAEKEELHDGAGSAQGAGQDRDHTAGRRGIPSGPCGDSDTEGYPAGI